MAKGLFILFMSFILFILFIFVHLPAARGPCSTMNGECDGSLGKTFEPVPTAREGRRRRTKIPADPEASCQPRCIDPDLPGKIGFDNRSFADLVASGPASESAPGVRIDRFMAPNGKQVTVSIAAPKLDGAYEVPPIQPAEDPAGYFANAISHAGPHRTIVFPKGGIYNFSSAGCQAAGAHLKPNAATDVVIDGNGCGALTIDAKLLE